MKTFSGSGPDGSFYKPRKKAACLNKVILSFAIIAVLADTLTRAAEIAYGVEDIDGRSPFDYSLIALASFCYLLYNLHFAREGVDTIKKTVKKFQPKTRPSPPTPSHFSQKSPFTKAALITAFLGLTATGAAWGTAADGSTNFFFLNSFYQTFDMDKINIPNYAWEIIAIGGAVLNVANYLLTEGTQAGLKLAGWMDLIDKGDDDPEIQELIAELKQAPVAYWMIKAFSTLLGLVGGSMEAAIAFVTMVVSFEIDSLPARMFILAGTLITLFMNYALRGTLIEETVGKTYLYLQNIKQDIKDGKVNINEVITDLLSTITSGVVGGSVAYVLQALTIAIFTKSFSDLDLATPELALKIFSSINAMNDAITFAEAFHEPTREYIIAPAVTRVSACISTLFGNKASYRNGFSVFNERDSIYEPILQKK